MTNIRTVIREPGNGTKYALAIGTIAGVPFVAWPDGRRAATMDTAPIEWTYVAEKLGVGEADARAILAILKEGA